MPEADGSAAGEEWKPARAILSDNRAGSALESEFKKRGIVVEIREFEDFLRRHQDVSVSDLVVGNHMWTRAALRHLGVPIPAPPDYPECLKHLLHRRVWQSTLGEMVDYVKSADTQTFIKPAIDAKTFSAVIEPRDQMLEVFLTGVPGTTMTPNPPDMPVHCAEVVDIVTEYRVYVVNGAIRSVCHYGGGPTDVALDMDVVEEAVRVLKDSDETRDVAEGCSLDFGLMRRKASEGDDELVTCLVEVNDGYSIGVYDGFCASDEADLLISRWGSLLKLRR